MFYRLRERVLRPQFCLWDESLWWCIGASANPITTNLLEVRPDVAGLFGNANWTRYLRSWHLTVDTDNRYGTQYGVHKYYSMVLSHVPVGHARLPTNGTSGTRGRCWPHHPCLCCMYRCKGSEEYHSCTGILWKISLIPALSQIIHYAYLSHVPLYWYLSYFRTVFLVLYYTAHDQWIGVHMISGIILYLVCIYTQSVILVINVSFAVWRLQGRPETTRPEDVPKQPEDFLFGYSPCLRTFFNNHSTQVVHAYKRQGSLWLIHPEVSYL